MLFLFSCPGTIPAPSCWPSCQTSCCAPPSPGCAAAASSCLSTTPLMAPTPSCRVNPQGWVAGQGCLHQPPQGLHGSGRHTWQSATPQPTAGQAPRWSRLPPSRSHFQTRWLPCLPLLRRRQATVQEPFFRSRTGFLHALYRRRHPSLHSSGTRTVSSHCLRD
jgi:hypothetical protein